MVDLKCTENLDLTVDDHEELEEFLNVKSLPPNVGFTSNLPSLDNFGNSPDLEVIVNINTLDVITEVETHVILPKDDRSSYPHKIFHCPHMGCKFMTSVKRSFIHHILIHEGEEPLKCKFDNCNFKTFYIGNLSKHHRSSVHSGIKVKRKKFPKASNGKTFYPCDFVGCAAVFLRHGNYYRHVQVHKSN